MLEKCHRDKSALAAVFYDDIASKFCGSFKIIKYGKTNNKQVCFSKSCARKFVPNEGLEGMKYDKVFNYIN